MGPRKEGELKQNVLTSEYLNSTYNIASESESYLPEVIFLDQGEDEPDKAENVHCKGNQSERGRKLMIAGQNKPTTLSFNSNEGKSKLQDCTNL